MLQKEVLVKMDRQQYRLIGKNKHSAVKICHWTKKSLRNEGCCYKEQFYGIKSHRCLQMTPCITCPNACLHCWRDESIIHAKWPFAKMDDPAKIVEKAIEAQRKLLSGFKGNEKVDLRKWKEAQNPNQVAISLAGEPTLYPKLGQLINEFKHRGFTTFLVTNGLYPEALKKLVGKHEPTQLYISLDAPDATTYKKFCHSSLKDAWQRLNKSLALMRKFKCKKVIRLTLVKEKNMTSTKKYADLIKIARPDFVEVKGFMHVGESQKRLEKEAMPTFVEIKRFAKELNKFLGYKIAGKNEISAVILLATH